MSQHSIIPINIPIPSVDPGRQATLERSNVSPPATEDHEARWVEVSTSPTNRSKLNACDPAAIHKEYAEVKLISWDFTSKKWWFNEI